jgi:hypothetical protein
MVGKVRQRYSYILRPSHVPSPLMAHAGIQHRSLTSAAGSGAGSIPALGHLSAHPGAPGLLTVSDDPTQPIPLMPGPTGSCRARPAHARPGFCRARPAHARPGFCRARPTHTGLGPLLSVPALSCRAQPAIVGPGPLISAGRLSSGDVTSPSKSRMPLALGPRPGSPSSDSDARRGPATRQARPCNTPGEALQHARPGPATRQARPCNTCRPTRMAARHSTRQGAVAPPSKCKV